MLYIHNIHFIKRSNKKKKETVTGLDLKKPFPGKLNRGNINESLNQLVVGHNEIDQGMSSLTIA
ncbi:MAG: hypothetical protein ABI741_08140 [Ferruginibacter sp.]